MPKRTSHANSQARPINPRSRPARSRPWITVFDLWRTLSACRVPTLPEPYTIDSRRLRDNQLKPKLLCFFGECANLLFAIPGLIVCGPLVHVLVTVFDEPVPYQAFGDVLWRSFHLRLD